jgi:putative transposase
LEHVRKPELKRKVMDGLRMGFDAGKPTAAVELLQRLTRKYEKSAP